MATSVEAEIRQLINSRDRAIGEKNLDAIMACYDDDLVYFDAIPPFQSRGKDGLRHGWDSCLPYFPDGFRIVSEELRIFGSGDSACAHWIWRFTDMPEDHGAMQTCLRATAVIQRRGGAWKIVHEHCSVPFDPHTSMAVFSLAP